MGELGAVLAYTFALAIIDGDTFIFPLLSLRLNHGPKKFGRFADGIFLLVCFNFSPEKSFTIFFQ